MQPVSEGALSSAIADLSVEVSIDILNTLNQKMDQYPGLYCTDMLQMLKSQLEERVGASSRRDESHLEDSNIQGDDSLVDLLGRRPRTISPLIAPEPERRALPRLPTRPPSQAYIHTISRSED